MRKKKSTFSFLPFFCILIMLGILAGMINAIPEGGGKTVAANVPVHKELVSSAKVKNYDDGIYHFTARQLMSRMGFAAIFGAIVGFFFAKQALSSYYHKVMRQCVNEIHSQYHGGRQKERLASLRGEQKN